MQDPTKTIKDLLDSASWTLSSPIARANITFRIGPPNDPKTRFTKGPISLEVDNTMGYPTKSTLSRSQVRRVITVDLWYLIKPATNAETARGHIFEMLEMINTILLANQRSASGLRLTYVGPDRKLDQLEDQVLRRQIDVVCLYEIAS